MLRDRYLVAGLLAILRSGRAYVPLTRDLPPVRVGEIVRILDIECILTSAALVEETASHVAGIADMRILAADDRTGDSFPPAPDRGDADDPPGPPYGRAAV